MEPMERRLSGIEDNTKKSAQAQNRWSRQISLHSLKVP
jgi:hypothetical protein